MDTLVARRVVGRTNRVGATGILEAASRPDRSEPKGITERSISASVAS